MIQTHGKSFIQSPILIGNIKAQFSLALLYQKKRAQDYQHLARKKYHGKMLLWQKRTVAIILWRNSSRSILRIIFSYYKPMKYMDIICIVTSIIYTFNIHGKHSNPQDHHLSYDAIIKNHEHYLQHRIHQSKYYLQKYFETCPIVSKITTNCPKAHCKYLWKTQKIFTNKSPWGMKTHGNMCTQPSPCEQAQAKNTSKRQRRTALVHS